MGKLIIQIQHYDAEAFLKIVRLTDIIPVKNTAINNIDEKRQVDDYDVQCGNY
jgi:hypothetical protein